MAEKLLGNCSKGLVFVISAPAGTGKNTLVNMLKQEFPHVITESVSCTTRSPRPGEEEGKDYYFLSKDVFDAKIQAGDFLEYATVFGNNYGTSREHVIKQQNKGKHVFLVIDTQGALQIKGKVPAIFIFISPPSLDELKKRLLTRKTENLESIEERLSWAQKEMALAGQYDYHMVNDQLKNAYEILRSIVIAEEHKVRKI